MPKRKLLFRLPSWPRSTLSTIQNNSVLPSVDKIDLDPGYIQMNSERNGKKNL